MTSLQLFLYPCLAFIVSVLDTSFFAFYEIFNSTIISSFLILIILVISDRKKVSLYFGSFCILFLSAFSSLPIYSMFLAYMGIPLIIFYIRQKIYFESNLFPALFVIFIANSLFRLLLLPLSDFQAESTIISLFSFPIINTLIGLVLFVMAKKYFFNKKAL